MENVKVFFNLGRSPRVRHLESVGNPPEGVTYTNDVASYSSYVDNSDRVLGKRHARISAAKKFMHYLRVPNVRHVRCGECDVIHTPGQLALNDKPWVCEVDNVAVLALYDLVVLKSAVGSRIIRRFLSNKNCRRILPISEASEKSIKNTFPGENFLDNTEVIYPHVKYTERKKRKDDKTRILFVSSHFFLKGGREVLNAFNELKKKYDDVELSMVTMAPEAVVSSNPDVSFVYPTLSKKELYERFYLSSDIFVLPSYQDSFGMVYLEALSCGLPVVATDIFAVPEMVEDGVNGFLVETPFKYFNDDCTPNPEYFGRDLEEYCMKTQFPKVTESLVEKISALIEDKSLREKMGERSHALVRDGRFSEKARKGKLRKVYGEALS
ncbi:MAG: glycosyltransferase family 4 protein [Candidatus Altiarchaeota archaeon]